MIAAPALLWVLALSQRGDRDNGPWLCRNSSLCCPEGGELLGSPAEVPPKGRIW